MTSLKGPAPLHCFDEFNIQEVSREIKQPVYFLNIILLFKGLLIIDCLDIFLLRLRQLGAYGLLMAIELMVAQNSCRMVRQGGNVMKFVSVVDGTLGTLKAVMESKQGDAGRLEVTRLLFSSAISELEMSDAQRRELLDGTMELLGDNLVWFVRRLQAYVTLSSNHHTRVLLLYMGEKFKALVEGRAEAPVCLVNIAFWLYSSLAGQPETVAKAHALARHFGNKVELWWADNLVRRELDDNGPMAQEFKRYMVNGIVERFSYQDIWFLVSPYYLELSGPQHYSRECILTDRLAVMFRLLQEYRSQPNIGQPKTNRDIERDCGPWIAELVEIMGKRGAVARLREINCPDDLLPV